AETGESAPSYRSAYFYTHRDLVDSANSFPAERGFTTAPASTHSAVSCCADNALCPAMITMSRWDEQRRRYRGRRAGKTPTNPPPQLGHPSPTRPLDPGPPERHIRIDPGIARGFEGVTHRQLLYFPARSACFGVCGGTGEVPGTSLSGRYPAGI